MTLSKGINKRHTSPVLDRFADLLAAEIGPGDAAERMGKRRSYGHALLLKIRKRLGAQAV
jgi:hypothetical protein